MAGVEFIRGEELRRRPFRVAVSPLCSLFMATRDAVGAQRSGTPEAWCKAIRAHLTPSYYDIFAPLATSQIVFVPDALVPVPTVPGLSFKDELERVVAIAEADLARDIHASRASGPTGDWRAAERHPERWVHDFAGALARAWNGFEPVWRLAQDAIAREVERVGVAMARDFQLELLDGLLPNAHVSDGKWSVHALENAELSLPDTGLIVVPLVCGERGSMLGGAGGVMTDLGYPLPAVPADAPAAPAPPASLEALLGPQRARILRELERPTTNNRLAEALHTVPSGITHHVNTLASAGLVTRERQGRHVAVRRTPRGEALLGLYRGS